MAPRESRPPLELTVDLDRFVFSGEARGRHEKRLVFAWGGLPDERVQARVIKKRRRAFDAVVTGVESPSPQRIEPREDHYLSCSPWQVMAEEHEAGWKAKLVRELFEERFELQLPDFSVATGEFYGYRNKLEFGFTETDDGLSLSFFQRGSWRRRIPADGCVLGMDAINTAARHVCRALNDRRTPLDHLKYLMLRCNQQGHVAASLYVTEAVDDLGECFAEHDGLTGLRVFHSDPNSPASVASELLQSHGSEFLHEDIAGRSFRFSDRSFLQVNIPMFETALGDIRRFVEPNDTLYDLFAGVGSIGISCGQNRVVFVESEEETAARLRENVAASSIPDAEVLVAPAEKVLTEVPSEATVVLDPPRAGVHPRVIKRLIESRPKQIIYLSCNPVTQAQDLTRLLEHYELAYFRAYNFFPRTPHLETLAVLATKSHA